LIGNADLSGNLFSYLNKRYRRRSIICLVRLEEWDTAVIRPHEGTISKDKSDRLQILWTLKANTSSILSLYQDSQRQLTSLLEAESRSEPFLEGKGSSGEVHYLWAITDPEKIDLITSAFRDKPLYIADGHHRYESALTYRREKRILSAASPDADTEKPFDFIMMTLVDMEDSGLLILPSHRLIRGISSSMASGLLNGLKTFFTVSEIPLNRENIRQQVDDLLIEKKNSVKLLLYGLTQERLLVLELDDFERVSVITPYFHSDLYQRLNVSIVDHVIMEKLLGITYDIAHEHLAYCSDSVDAINGINEEYQLAVLLNPVTPEAIKTIADSGDRMPRKSTYFYPKIPTGLVFYKFE